MHTDGSNAFARRSMADRVPSIIGEVIERNADYPPSIKDALRELKEDIATDQPLRLPRLPAPDFDLWAARFQPHDGDTWLNAEWLFSEMLAYRLVLEACRYWTTRRDPFDPFKKEELASDALWDTLSLALEEGKGDRAARLHGQLLAALWGNRLDYSIEASAAQGAVAQDDQLLANDLPRVAEHLASTSPGAVHIIMDNAGTEQACDLALADFLLEGGWARSVTLHIKMQPTLVSDATAKDVRRLFEAMKAQGGPAAALEERIRRHIAAGRLQIAPDFFWTADGRLWELPPRLHQTLREARLVITKGDLNYRRTTGDAIWPRGATLAEAARGFPAPLLALRTVKSDTLVGVEAATVERLDTQEEGNWRTDGTYGVAQFAQLDG